MRLRGLTLNIIQEMLTLKLQDSLENHLKQLSFGLFSYLNGNKVKQKIVLHTQSAIIQHFYPL